MRTVGLAVVATIALGTTAADAFSNQRPPLATFGPKHALSCYIEKWKELYVATATPPQLPAGTVVHFTTQRDSDGSSYSSTVTAAKPITVHVYAGMDNLPSIFKPGAPCTAYWVSPPTLKAN